MSASSRGVAAAISSTRTTPRAVSMSASNPMHGPARRIALSACHRPIERVNGLHDRVGRTRPSAARWCPRRRPAPLDDGRDVVLEPRRTDRVDAHRDSRRPPRRNAGSHRPPAAASRRSSATRERRPRGRSRPHPRPGRPPSPASTTTSPARRARLVAAGSSHRDACGPRQPCPSSGSGFHSARSRRASSAGLVPGSRDQGSGRQSLPSRRSSRCRAARRARRTRR